MKKEEVKSLINKLVNNFNYKPLNKTLSKKYREIFEDNIPEFLNIKGDSIKLYNKCGTLICNGYSRIVVGDYGAFVEYSPHQAKIRQYKVKPGEEYRLNSSESSRNIKYYWYTTKDSSNIKIYHQQRTVPYANYKPGFFYVSPYEVYTNEHIRMLEPWK